MLLHQRIMHDQIVAAEQMPDHRNVRRMSATSATQSRSHGGASARSSLAVQRSLAGNRLAGRDRGAVAVDRSLAAAEIRGCPLRPIVVGSEADVRLSPIRFRVGDASWTRKERIGDVEKLRGLPNRRSREPLSPTHRALAVASTASQEERGE
jgi:hypothetical protein